MFFFRRRFVLCVLAVLTIAALVHVTRRPAITNLPDEYTERPSAPSSRFEWKKLPQRHPVRNLTTLPNGPLSPIPRIQAEFGAEGEEERAVRLGRLAAVKEAFVHSWNGYKNNAWLQDEVSPLSGNHNNEFGGWGATLVDSLDTLWIMGLEDEFTAALSELRKIDFSSSPLVTLNIFETTIRYLGGFLSAYDISGHKYTILLDKAAELGEMLYVAFDTSNRMPVTRWDWHKAVLGEEQHSNKHSLLAEVGSLTLEFTRLSQLTGDHKWYDAVARISNVLQERQTQTKIPGLWPVLIDTRNLDFSMDITFTLGGQSDSMYEYLPKQHLMLGGRSDQYRDMYLTAFESAKEQLFFQPLHPNNEKVLLTGTLKRFSAGRTRLIPESQHLSCFTGGMVALAAKIFQQTHELETARQLVEGCLWAYESMPTGVMPENFRAAPCFGDMYQNCTWSEENWYDAIAKHINHGAETRQDPIEQAQKVIKQNRLAPGMTEILDSRYHLRPEAIESVFVLYRITGDKALQDKAWNMFQAIREAAKTDIAFAAIGDVTEKSPPLYDSMESFWTAETLKYFYLMFSEPDVVSLDEYVLNTEAHPLLRPK